MKRAVTLSIVLIMLSTALCQAQSAEAYSTDSVHFELMPYLIVPGMSGDSTVKGNRQTINANARDIFSHLQFGFMARSRLSYRRVFAGTDTVYMGLGGANNLVDAGFDSWAAELVGGYHVHKQIALLGGVRYNSLSMNLRFKGQQGISLGGSQVWWDPFFGGEGTVPLTRKLNFSARFDLGGFGVGSRIAVNSEPLLKYQVNQRLTANIGWKFFYQDYVNTGRAFEYDVLTQGPVLGIAIRW